MNRTQSQRIVNAILEELSGRRGFRHIIDEVHDDNVVWPELYAYLVSKVESASTANDNPADSRFYVETQLQ